MKPSLLLAGALLLVAPIALILPGCGGGGNVLRAPNQPTQTYLSNLTLGSSQNARISVSIAGERATGTLVVSPAVASPLKAQEKNSANNTKSAQIKNAVTKGLQATSAQVRGAQAVSSDPLPEGTFTFASTKTGGVTVTLTSTTPQGVTPAGTFSLSLTFSQGSTSGTMSLSFNGVEVGTGIFDLSATPTNTATPTPSATDEPSRTPLPPGNEVTLTYSRSGKTFYGFGPSPFTSQEVAVSSDFKGTTIDVNRSLANPTDRGRRFTLLISKSPGGIQQGDEYRVGGLASVSVFDPGFANGGCSSTVENSCGFGGSGQDGTISVRREGNNVEFTLFNVVVNNPTIETSLTFSGTIRVTFPQSA